MLSTDPVSIVSHEGRRTKGADVLTTHSLQRLIGPDSIRGDSGLKCLRCSPEPCVLKASGQEDGQG